MGAINHGTQEITYDYYENMTSAIVNSRHIGTKQCGIYSGGYLTKVTDSEITISSMLVEIGDGSIQTRVKTSTSATLNGTTLDSGNISSSTPYIILRRSYLASIVNYMEIRAIASLSVALSNDIVVGKCLFSGATLTGFDYSERTFINVQDLFLKVESTGATEMYVQLRAGRIQNSSGYVFIPEQKVGPFSVPSSPNSRIDLVYINDSGTPQILQGTDGVSPVAPNYGGKLIVAQVRIVNGDTNISSSRITDVRSFITSLNSNITVKAQVNFAGRATNGVCVINNSMNVTSVNRQSSGIYRITFTSPMPNIYYGFSGYGRGTVGASGGVIIGLSGGVGAGLKTTSYVDIAINENNTTVDPTEISITFFA